MHKYGRFLRLSFYIAPIVAAILYAMSLFMEQQHNNKFKSVGKETFIEIALESSDNRFYKDYYLWKVITPEGEQYQTKTKHVYFKELEDRYIKKYGHFYHGYDSFSYGWVYLVLMIIGIYLGAILLIVPWFVVLFDILQSEFLVSHNKIIWLVVLFIMPIITPLFYIAIADGQKV